MRVAGFNGVEHHWLDLLEVVSGPQFGLDLSWLSRILVSVS